MREPTLCEQGDDGDCLACFVPWPCPRWQQWTATKEYRIRELEAKVRQLEKDRYNQGKVLTDHRKDIYELKTSLAGIWPALVDLLDGVSGGHLSVRVHHDDQEIGTFDGGIHRIVGMTERVVGYTSPGGFTYENGKCTERRSR